MKQLFLFSLIVIYFFSFVIGSDSKPINEYYQKQETKELIDKIIAVAGGEENLEKASSASYDALVNLNLIGLKISYQQTVKRHAHLFVMEKDIMGEKIITGFDGEEIYQAAYGYLFSIPEYKKAEIQFIFSSTMPHQYVLKLKQKDFALKYLGLQEKNGRKLLTFQHMSVVGEELHCFDPETFHPILSISMTKGLEWQVTRNNFRQQDGISYPILIQMNLNKEDLYQITVMKMDFNSIDKSAFKKPNYSKIGVILQPFAAQMRLKEIYKALQLAREYDPVNRSYPLPEKVKTMMGVQPQLANPSLKIGIKDMFTYDLFRGKAADRLDFDAYPYILKGNVHNFTPLVWDKKGNYKTGRNVLFADGSVQFLSETQFEAYYNASVKRYPIIQVEIEK